MKGQTLMEKLHLWKYPHMCEQGNKQILTKPEG